MDDTLPNPLKNFTPRRSPEKKEQSAPKSDTLEYVKGLSNDQLEVIAIEKLSEALQTVNATDKPDLAARLANAILDRTRGKPAQSITQVSTVNVNLMAQEIQQQSIAAVQEALLRLTAPTIDN